MEGNVNFTGSLSGSISGEGGCGETPVILADATVDNETGTPTVTVTRTGSDEQPTFHFAFQNLKGAKGDTGDEGQPGDTPNVTADASISGTTGTPSVTVTKTGTPSDPVLHFEFMNLKGDTGQQGPEGPAGGSVAIEANPSGTATVDLTKILIDSTIYKIAGGSEIDVLYESRVANDNIVLDTSIYDYDLIIFTGAVVNGYLGYDYTQAQPFYTPTITSSTAIGFADDGSYTWYNMPDGTHVNFAFNGGNKYIITSIVGIKLG